MSDVVDSIFQNPVFETERLVAGRWHPDLAPAAFKIYGDQNVTQWLGGNKETSVESMVERIQWLIDRNSKWPDSWGSWPTFLKSSHDLVGALLMKPLPDADGEFTPEIEIGWHLRFDQWGKGLASEGGKKLVQLAFEEHGQREVFAVTDPTNVRSQNVTRRIGMDYVGQTDAYYGLTLDLFKITNPRQIAPCS